MTKSESSITKWESANRRNGHFRNAVKSDEKDRDSSRLPNASLSFAMPNASVNKVADVDRREKKLVMYSGGRSGTPAGSCDSSISHVPCGRPPRVMIA